MPLVNPFSSSIVSSLLLISSTGVQISTLIVLALSLPMKSSAVVYSPSPSHTGICEYIMSFEISETNLLNYSWRRTRRAAHEGLTKVAIRDYHPILRKEAILLSSALLENPEALEKHFQRFAASAIMSILYDHPTLENEHDKTLTAIHVFIDRISAAAGLGAHLVELFPWMMYIPERYVSTPPKYV
jgi:hypothetical protein